MSNQNKLQEKLKQMQENTQQPDKKKVIQGIADPEVTEPDFAKMAEDLQARHEQKKHSVNDGYTKDTVYIRDDIYKAFNALVTKRGLKKELMNEALADFVIKKYREIQREEK